MAAVDLALYQLKQPVLGEVSWEAIQEAAAQLPQLQALWERATPEERGEWVIRFLEPQGLYYDLEQHLIAALKPRRPFVPLLQGSPVFCADTNKEAPGLLVTERWWKRNRRDSNPRSLA